jgi:hypothetical protein
LNIKNNGCRGVFSSTIAGGKFIDGFKQGVIVAGLNHLAKHMAQRQKFKADFSKLKTVENVLKGKDFVSFEDGDYICGKAARMQNLKGGANPVYDQQQTAMYLKSGETSPLTLDIQGGIDIMIENLLKGKPIMAGVMYDMTKNTGNLNDATNHYINIVGMGVENGKYYFSYYDNYGYNNTNTVMNRLYWNSNGYFYDSTNISTYSPTTRNFILTEIRKNQ